MGKPICKLSEEDGNIFNLLSVVKRALKAKGLRNEADECQSRVLKAESYERALLILGEYVDYE